MKNILHILLILFFCLTIISCSKKDDDSSSSSSATTLSPPSDLTAAGAASQVTLDWTAVSGASSYNVYWDTARASVLTAQPSPVSAPITTLTTAWTMARPTITKLPPSIPLEPEPSLLKLMLLHLFLHQIIYLPVEQIILLH